MIIIKDSLRKFYRSYRPEIFGFLIPFLIESFAVSVMYLICHYGISSCDCFAQYIPFFTEFYDKLTSGESLLFSWSGALGYDFWSVFAYYLASPLNWIIFLFGRKGMAFSLNLLIILKTSLCGASFVRFVRVKYGHTGFKLPVLFGTMFALSGYTFGYCFNVMWFDSIILFPLILLAIDRMLYEKKSAKYCFLLALSLIFNYFVGFMTCIFIFLYFFTCKFDSVKDFFKKFFRIGWSSVLAIGAAAIILLPSYLVLKSTSISTEDIPGFTALGSWGDCLYNILFGTNPAAITWTSSRANMFISGLGVFMAFVFLSSKSFPVKEKLGYLFLLGVLFVSCNTAILNYVWHGFHAQNGIPNRFSFMMIFIILVMGYRAAQKRRRIKTCELCIAAALHLALIFVIYLFKRYYLEECIVTGGIALLYLMVVIYSTGSRKLSRYTFVPVLVELTVMLFLSIINVTGMSLDGYFHYVDDMLDAKELTDSQYDGFYRQRLDQSNNLNEYKMNDDYDYVNISKLNVGEMLDMLKTIRNVGHHSVLNEESLYSMNAASLFNTFTNAGVSDFVKKTGGSGSSNTILYRGENAFMDMLLGFRYYFARYHTSNSSAYEYYDTVGEVDIYKNKYPLSVGYSAPAEYAGLSNYYKSNPFSTMNTMSEAICGGKVYSSRKLVYDGCEDCTEDDLSSNYAKFTNTSFKSKVYFSYDAKKDENLHIYVPCGDMYLIEVRINGELTVQDRASRQLLDLGNISAGDHVAITVILKAKDELTMNYYAGAFHESVLQNCYEILSENQLDVTCFDDNTIEGTVTIPENDTDFIITVPYSSGWTVTDNGEVIEAEKFSDTFIRLTLSAGEHELRLNYVTPGFKYGAISSAVCFSMIGLIRIVESKKKKTVIAA